MASRVVELARNGDYAVCKKYGMSYAEFVRDHLRPGIPVVIGDAAQDWPAAQAFTPQYFRERYADATVEVGRYNSLEDGHMQLGAFLELAERATAERPAPYPCKLALDGSRPELERMVQPRLSYSLPDFSEHWLVPKRLRFGARSEVFFGSPGGLFPYLHIDYMGLHAFITQIYGDKEFVAIPPQQTACVYPDPARPWVSSIADHHHPDLSRYPDYARATPVHFVVGAGESLFIPNGWWHSARSVTMTIAVVQDILGASNWPHFAAEVRKLYPQRWKALIAGGYLAGAGQLLRLLSPHRA